MKIDFNQSITRLDGAPMLEAETGKELTLGMVAIEALLGVLANDQGQPERQTGDDKVRQGVLATNIFTATEALDLKAEDIALLKNRIGRAYPPLVVMRAYALLDPS